MSKRENNIIIKYTLMPYSVDDDYELFFELSLKELVKNTKEKSLLAPLIIHNSELDVPMENELEDYTVYCNKSQILDVIKKQEINDVFRTLIIHGFDISLDELREKFVPIAKRNYADLCINTIEDTGVNSNITLYIDEDIHKCSEESWLEQKEQINNEINDFIYSYDEDYINYNEDISEFLKSLFDSSNYLFNDIDDFYDDIDYEEEYEYHKPKVLKFKDIEEEEDKNINNDIVSYSFNHKDEIIKISYSEDELFVLQDNDYQVVFDKCQMDFLIETYSKIQALINDSKPRK